MAARDALAPLADQLTVVRKQLGHARRGVTSALRQGEIRPVEAERRLWVWESVYATLADVERGNVETRCFCLRQGDALRASGALDRPQGREGNGGVQ